MTDAGPFQGGCQCGAIRYTIRLKTLIAYACHCSECKKQSASSFAISVPIPAKYLHLTGQLSNYTRSTDSGASTSCVFCPSCGTRVYHQSDRSPELVTIKGGTLDEIANLPLVAHLWTTRKHAWIELPADAENFETQPTDLKQWRNNLISKLEAMVS
jgi:hypothetical protein